MLLVNQDMRQSDKIMNDESLVFSNFPNILTFKNQILLTISSLKLIIEILSKIYGAIESEANNFMLLNCSFLNKKCITLNKANEVHHGIRKKDCLKC